MRDRVGVGWRRELAAGLFAHLDGIDIIEVIADDYLNAPRREVQALRRLSSLKPICLHGIGLGMASSFPVETRRLERMARLMDQVQPEFWSEHLAFVRAGGTEIGHLAAPPRTRATVDGAAENLERARKVVGVRPVMENIATLVEPPGSSLPEAPWISEILEAAGCHLLLDLHKVYANALNHGYDAIDFLESLPLDRVEAVHIAGGRWVESPGGANRMLDDHLHDVPGDVFALLEELAFRAPRPLTVILERDGQYPAFPQLLAQMQEARAAMERGRRRRSGEEDTAA
jgi:hypothetical protein